MQVYIFETIQNEHTDSKGLENITVRRDLLGPPPAV